MEESTVECDQLVCPFSLPDELSYLKSCFVSFWKMYKVCKIEAFSNMDVSNCCRKSLQGLMHNSFYGQVNYI